MLCLENLITSKIHQGFYTLRKLWFLTIFSAVKEIATLGVAHFKGHYKEKHKVNIEEMVKIKVNLSKLCWRRGKQIAYVVDV